MITTLIKQSGLSILILLIGLVSLNHSVLAQEQEDTNKTYIKIQVDGLSCPFCAYGLEKKLKELEGAKDVFISVEGGYTVFNVPKNKQLTKDELKKVVKDAGFTARQVVFSDKPFDKEDEK